MSSANASFPASFKSTARPPRFRATIAFDVIADACAVDHLIVAGALYYGADRCRSLSDAYRPAHASFDPHLHAFPFQQCSDPRPQTLPAFFLGEPHSSIKKKGRNARSTVGEVTEEQKASVVTCACAQVRVLLYSSSDCVIRLSSFSLSSATNSV